MFFAALFMSCDFRGPLIAEETIETDKEVVEQRYGTYKWYETSIELNHFLDEDGKGVIANMTNVFQIEQNMDDGSIDTYVVYIKSKSRSNRTLEIKHGFYLENEPMNNDTLKIKFHQAYLRLMATNCPKPHSKQVVLRKQVGPVKANPQWIFGNTENHVFVDAITGKVSTVNPAFPEGE